MVLLTLRTGLRLGEQLALHWGDVDWQRKFILVQRYLVRRVLTSPESHQRRRVDMSEQLLTTLQDWRRVRQSRWLKKGEELPLWAFPSREGTAMEERNVRHAFTRLFARAKLRNVRIHDLR